MKIDVTFTPSELARTDLRERTVVVLDVVRASSTIAQGMASGAAAFVPVRSVTAARRAARQYPPAVRLLGGERDGVRIPGFDLGNSPREFTAARVSGKTIVFTTTNGTAAISAARAAQRTYIGAFVNLAAVADCLLREDADVTLAAAGRRDRPVLDDVACAGAFIQALQQKVGCELTDSAKIALRLWEPYQGRVRDLLADSASGRALIHIGYDLDLDFCGQTSVLNVAPRVLEGKVGVDRQFIA